MICSKPSGVVSLYQLLDFNAKIFIDVGSLLREMETLYNITSGSKDDPDPRDLNRMSVCLEILAKLCEFHGMLSGQKKCERILRGMEGGGISSPHDLHASLKELRERIEDELDEQKFLHLDPREARDFTFPLSKWKEVAERFPELKTNLEECSRCFALDRFGASVYYAMLIAEYGIIRVAKLIEIQDPYKPGWNDLDKVQKALQKPHSDRSPLVTKHFDFVSGFIPLAVSIRDTWRHPLNHVDKQLQWMYTDFNQRIAGEILSATAGLMRRLANDLPEDSQ